MYIYIFLPNIAMLQTLCFARKQRQKAAVKSTGGNKSSILVSLDRELKFYARESGNQQEIFRIQSCFALGERKIFSHRPLVTEEKERWRQVNKEVMIVKAGRQHEYIQTEKCFPVGEDSTTYLIRKQTEIRLHNRNDSVCQMKIVQLSMVKEEDGLG